MKEIPRYNISSYKALRSVQSDFPGFRETLLDFHNDICQCKIFNINIIVINKPSYIKHILYDNSKNYKKIMPTNTLNQSMLKNALIFINDLEHWKKDKISMMPAFQKGHYENYCQVFTENCQEMLNGWQAYAEKDQPIKIYEIMSHLTLKNLVQTLFGNIPLDIEKFTELLVSVLADFSAQTRSIFGLKWKLPTAARSKYLSNVALLESLVEGMISERKNYQGNNLIDMLIATYKNHPNQEEIDEYVKSEVLGMLVAGHETTSAALAWIWVLLSEQPTVTQKIRQEVTDVLQGRTPSYEDLAKMPYTRGVVLETLRIYPPANGVSRKVMEDDEIDGYRIPAKSHISVVIPSVNKREEYWGNPQGFNPERFSSIDLRNEYLYAYLSFGAGPRICIGKDFSLVEMCLIVAMVVQKFDLYLLSNFKLEKTTKALIVSPQYDLLMKLKRIE